MVSTYLKPTFNKEVRIESKRSRAIICVNMLAGSICATAEYTLVAIRTSIIAKESVVDIIFRRLFSAL